MPNNDDVARAVSRANTLAAALLVAVGRLEQAGPEDRPALLAEVLRLQGELNSVPRLDGNAPFAVARAAVALVAAQAAQLGTDLSHLLDAYEAGLMFEQERGNPDRE